jgi:hypothetical protein
MYLNAEHLSSSEIESDPPSLVIFMGPLINLVSAAAPISNAVESLIN